MQKLKHLYMLGLGAIVVGALGGCATSPEPAPTPAEAVAEDRSKEPPSPPPIELRAERVNEETPADQGLTEVERRFSAGLEQYNEGQYANAIRIFREPVFDRAWPELKVRALKYLAFSYCVSNNLEACRSTFTRLLAVSPDFVLSAAERGHPIWGPAFQQAKTKARPAK